MARNKFEVVERDALREKDVVTVVQLTDGQVYPNITVTYVVPKGSSSGGFDANSQGRTSAYGDLSFFDMSKIVVIRERKLPKNWPPQKNDVWKVDGTVWHYAFTNGLVRTGGGAVATKPDTLLETAEAEPELLFRLDK